MLHSSIYLKNVQHLVNRLIYAYLIVSYNIIQHIVTIIYEYFIYICG